MTPHVTRSAPGSPIPRNGGIAPDAIANFILKMDGSTLESTLENAFNSLKTTGDWPSKRKISPVPSTELEERIDSGLLHLSFRYGGFAECPISREAYEQRQREELPELDAFLELAFDGQGWRVGPYTAAHISSNRWFNAMALNDYERAEAEIERCLRHPGPFDRHYRSELPIQLNVPRLFGDEAPDAAQSLITHIESGIYSRGQIALSIGRTLSACLDKTPDKPFSTPIRALVEKILQARKSPKRLLLACERARTMAELLPILGEACEPRWPRSG